MSRCPGNPSAHPGSAPAPCHSIPARSISARSLAYADRLGEQGEGELAAEVREAVAEYRALVAAGDPMGALPGLGRATAGPLTRPGAG